MSRSSSTINISSAMIFSVLPVPDAPRDRFILPHILLPALPGQGPEPVGMERQGHARPLPRRIVRKFKFAIMLLDDLLDDREAEAGAALPRRHIGFGDRVARLGQPDTVVGNPADDLSPGADFECRADMAGRGRLGIFIFLFNRFDGIPTQRKSNRLNSSHDCPPRMPSSALKT